MVIMIWLMHASIACIKTDACNLFHSYFTLTQFPCLADESQCKESNQIQCTFLWSSVASNSSRAPQYNPPTVTNWENMTWAALSYNCLSHLPEPCLPPLSLPPSLLRLPPPAPTHCTVLQKHLHGNTDKTPRTHAFAHGPRFSVWFVTLQSAQLQQWFNNRLSPCGRSRKSLISGPSILHMFSSSCQWWRVTALPVGSDPEEVFDVAVWLHRSILTAYCNTICSTSGLQQSQPAMVPSTVRGHEAENIRGWKQTTVAWWWVVYSKKVPGIDSCKHICIWV